MFSCINNAIKCCIFYNLIALSICMAISNTGIKQSSAEEGPMKWSSNELRLHEQNNVAIFFAVFFVGFFIISLLTIYMCKNNYCNIKENAGNNATVIHPPPPINAISMPSFGDSMNVFPTNPNFVSYHSSYRPPNVNLDSDRPPDYATVVLNDLSSTSPPKYFSVTQPREDS